MIATKQQEREALQQIKNIVERLGEDSYLAAAFTGVFELAERNIEDDAAFTMIGEAQAIADEATRKMNKAMELTQEAKKEMEKAKEIQKRFEMNREYWEDIRKSLDWAAYQLSDKLGY